MEDSFKIKKPGGWPRFPLYKKIKYYAKCMNSMYSPFVDKLQAKEIVTRMCSSIKVATVVKILKDTNDIHTSDLKSHYYLKASHGSGWNIDLHGKTIHDIIPIRNKLKSWNKIYSETEKQYKYLVPRFFIETKVNDRYTGLTSKANVFMIRCIYGNPVSIGVMMNTKNYLYDTEWSQLDTFEDTISKPDELPELLYYASVLSRPFEFVRVDMYIGVDGVYFSEFTFTPAGGNKVFPLSTEMEMGKSWV